VVEPVDRRTIDMDRTITRIDGKVITIDAPLHPRAGQATTPTAAGRSASTPRPGGISNSRRRIHHRADRRSTAIRSGSDRV
jgi:hypothetical protein